MGDLQRVDEKILPNGDIYIGNLEGLLPHGMGKYIWLDGTIYEGEWEKSKMTGKGRISWPSGAKYEGDFCGGFIHGSGTFSGPDGSIYTGSWLMNKQNGHGRKTYSNLDVYEGSWKEGIQEGIGRYVWSTGNAYIGNWKAGKMCSRGVMKWVNGDLFDGFWQDGMEHGSGYYKFADGGFYFGTWSRGLKDGRGTFFPAGSRLPPVKRWYDSVGYFDGQQNRLHCTRLSSSEELQNGKLGAKSTGSDRWSISHFFKGSGRISHRSTSLNGLWSIHDFLGELPLQENDVMSSSSLDEGQPSPKDENVTVYERDYMQGILMMERIRDKRLSKKSKWLQKCKEKEGTKPGETVIKGHKSYHLMLNLQLGIRYSVGKITPVPVRQVRSSDFGPQARIRMHFPKEGSQFTPSHYSIDFYWKDYCPIVFRNLREMFKIDAADYMMSICGCDGLKELSSPGKSGSIFYLSQDERFVIKTLKKSELKILLKMLPKYYNHVESHDNTLITKFFGLHRIKLKGGRKVRFVVMGNMFCTELHIHRRYDLKGSSHGRSSDPNKINGNTTLKDLDLSYVFHMQKSWRESLFKQLSLDCAFLESQCIIDYSLLLGLHFRAPEHLKDILETPDAHATSSADDGEVSLVGEPPIPPRGLLLVTHEPGSISAIQGSHIRGSGLKVSAAGDQEVDLLLRGTGRLRVQLGVNMPAKATHKVLHDEGLDSTETDLFEACDVVLYLGIIDILQDYNVIKKIEHTYKSLLFDPLSISAVEPKLYSKRFISFLEKVFPEQV